MRIKRMTVILPARLRHAAEHEARRIADEAAQQLVQHQGSANLRIELPGQGLSGHALSAAVGRSLAAQNKGKG